MPGYISHTLMARDTYNKLDQKNVNLDYMITYSLGGDLSKYSKCRRDTHKIDKDKFIYNMCNYLIDNKLTNDSECLGVLYGHICHTMMDDILHPLIRKVDSITGHNNHTLIELYIDNYLLKNKFSIPLNKYDNRCLFKGYMNKKIRKMIDYVYNETYKTSHVSYYYIFNKMLYKKSRYIYKIFSINFLKRVTGYDRFINNNSNIDILNLDHHIEYKDFLGFHCNDDLMTLYDDSVINALLYIDNVNNYLGSKS